MASLNQAAVIIAVTCLNIPASARKSCPQGTGNTATSVHLALCSWSMIVCICLMIFEKGTKGFIGKPPQVSLFSEDKKETAAKN